MLSALLQLQILQHHHPRQLLYPIWTYTYQELIDPFLFGHCSVVSLHRNHQPMSEEIFRLSLLLFLYVPQCKYLAHSLYAMLHDGCDYCRYSLNQFSSMQESMYSQPSSRDRRSHHGMKQRNQQIWLLCFVAQGAPLPHFRSYQVLRQS